ncbi:MAG: hypothetical protein RLZZ387_2743 [Chloroflexota bacterium]|jgi:hypothetical protein
MVIAQGDLVLATHGRSFWVLDDLALVRQMAEVAEGASAAKLFTPRDTARFGRLFDFGAPAQNGRNYIFVAGMMAAFEQAKTPGGETKRSWLDVGTNPADGVVVSYLLPEEAEGKLTLTFRDAQGAEIRTFKSKKKDEKPKAESAAQGAAGETDAAGESAVAPGESQPTAAPTVPPEDKDDEPKAPAKAGLNRFAWDLRGAPAQKITSGEGHKDVDLSAPRVPPGRYWVELKVGEEAQVANITILPDPRVSTTQAEYEAQYALLRRIHGMVDGAHKAVNRIRAVSEQLDGWTKRSEKLESGARIAAAAKALKAKLTAVEEKLIQVKARSNQDTLNFPVMLNAKIAALAGAVSSAEAAPTRAQEMLCEDLATRLSEQLGVLEVALAQDLPAFNTLVREADVPAIIVE